MLISLFTDRLRRLRGTQRRHSGHRGTNRHTTPATHTEIVEERVLLAAVSWDGEGGDSLWSNPLNWRDDQLPATGDDVTIDAGSDTVDFDISAGLNVNSLTLNSDLEVTSGALQVAASAIVVPGTTLSIVGTASSFAATTAASIDGMSIIVSGGGSASFPLVAAYKPAGARGPTFRATGANSVIDLSGVQDLDFSVAHGSFLDIQAQQGGAVDLSGVTQMSDGTGAARGVRISADGVNSRVDLTTLQSLLDNSDWDGTWHSRIDATNSGVVDVPLLHRIRDVDITRDGTGTLLLPELTASVDSHFEVTSGVLDLPKLTTLENGSLTISNGANINVPELFNITGASLFVSGGQTLTLPMVTDYQAAGAHAPTFRSTGANSVIDLSGVQNLEFSVAHISFLDIQAQQGGVVDLSGVTQMSDGTGAARGVRISADGVNSRVDLTALQSLLDNSDWDGTWHSRIDSTNSGVVHVPVLDRIRDVDITRDGTGTLLLPELTASTDSHFEVTSGVLDLPKLTTLDHGSLTISNGANVNVPELFNINGASLFVSGGQTLTLPMVTDYQAAGAHAPTFRATGANSVIDLSGVQNLDFSVAHISFLDIQARQGGVVDLSGVTQMSDGTSAARGVRISADGVNSRVDLTALQSLLDNSDWDGTWHSRIDATNSGVVHVPILDRIRDVDITRDGTGTLLLPELTASVDSQFEVTSGVLDLPKLTTLDHGSLTISNGANVIVPELFNITGASLFVSGGQTLTLPMVTDYQAAGAHAPTFRATGANSVIDLSGVQNLDFSVAHISFLDIQAQQGGVVDLSGVTQMSDGTGAARGVRISADGVNSRVDLTALQSLLDNSDWDGTWHSRIDATNSGVVHVPILDRIRDVDITRDGTGTLLLSELTASVDSHFEVTSGILELPKLTTLEQGSLTISNGANINAPELFNINGASLFVSGGQTLTLPMVTDYQAAGAHAPTFRATGANSVIDLSGVQNLEFSVAHISFLDIQARQGGVVDLSGVTQMSDGTSAARGVRISADGVGSRIDLTALQSLLDNSDWDGTWHSRIDATNSGVVDVPILDRIRDVDITRDGTGTLLLPELTASVDSHFEVTSGVLDLPKLMTLEHGSLTISNGANVNVPELFNINGASLFVSGGQTLTLPMVADYQSAEARNPTFRATGANSVIDLSGVQNLEFSVAHTTFLDIQAQQGGVVDLSGVTQMSDGTSAARGVRISADGANSRVDLTPLQSLLDNSEWDGNWRSQIDISDGGSISVGELVRLKQVEVSLEDTHSRLLGGINLISDSQLTGDGQIVGNVESSSVIQISNGRLSVDGALRLHDAATIEVGPESMLAVSGRAALAGTLSLEGFTPVPGLFTDFPVITGATITGQFSAVTGGDVDPDPDLTAHYGSSAVVLSRNFDRAELDTFTYSNSTADDRVFFDVQQVTDAPVSFRLYDPAGNFVFASNAHPDDPSAGDFGPFRLNAVGDYEIRTYAQPTDNPAYVYDLMPAPTMTYPLMLNREQTGQIAVPGEEHRYLLDVTDPAEFTLNVTSIIGDGELIFTIVAPSGRTAFRATTDNSTPPEERMQTLLLNEIGTWELRITGAGDDTASYQFLSSGPASPQIIAHNLEASANAGFVNAAVFHFNQNMDTSAGNFSLTDDLLTFSNGTSDLTATAATWRNAATLVIRFADQPDDVPLTMTLGSNILSAAGVPLDQDADGNAGEPADDRYAATLLLDEIGPRVFLTDPQNEASAQIDHITFHFNETLNAASVSAADITSFSGPNGSLLTVVGDVLVNGADVTVFFAEQVTSGSYSMTLGPDILDIAGNSMDQNQDGQSGQANDSFTATISLLTANLFVQSVDDPVAATYGDNITAGWTVRNDGTDDAVGQWWDYVYISSDDKWDLSDALLGRVVYDSGTRGAVAANGGTYDATLTARLPGLLPGDYHIIVRSNLLRSLPESNLNDNRLTSTSTAAFDLPMLTDGVADSQPALYRGRHFYQIELPESVRGGSVLLRFGTDNTDVPNELYLRRGALPSRATYDHRSQQGLSSNQYIIVSNVEPGTWYVMGATAPDSGRIDALGTATTSVEFLVPGEFTVLDTHFGQGGTAGNRTIEINGANFDRSITVKLSNGSNDVAEAVSYYRTGPEKLFATFDLSGVNAGLFDVSLQNAAGQTEIIVQSFEVVDAVRRGLDFTISMPPAFRRVFHAPLIEVPVTIGWTNHSLNDIFTPLIELTGNEPIRFDGQSAQLTDRFYAAVGSVAADSPPGVLLPGASSQRNFSFLPLLRGEIDTSNLLLSLHNLMEDSASPVDWDFYEPSIQAVNSSSLDHNEIIAYLQHNAGPNVGAWNATLSGYANIIKTQGRPQLPEILHPLVQDTVAALTGSISGRLASASFLIDLSDRVVQATDASTGAVFSAVTRRDGSFALTELPRGSYQLSVDGLEILPTDQRVFEVAADTPVVGITLNVRERPVLSVQVLDMETNQPITDAVVAIFRDDLPANSMLTDTDGFATIQLSEHGIVSVRVEATGFARRFVPDVSSDVNVQALVVELERETALAGRIVTSEGLPAVQAGVVAIRLDSAADTSAASRFVAATDDSGTFSLNGLSVGEYEIVAVNRSGEFHVIDSVMVREKVTDLGTVQLQPEVSASENSGQISPPPEETPPPWGGPSYGRLLDIFLTTYEIETRLLIPLIIPFRGPQFASVVLQFVTNQAPNRIHRTFGKGSETVEGYAGFLSDNRGLRFYARRQFNEVWKVASEQLIKKLTSEDPEVCERVKKGGSFSIAELIPDELAWLYRIDGNDPGLTQNINNYWTYPATLAGGVGHGGLPPAITQVPDSRRIDGTLVAKQSGKNTIEIEAKGFRMTVEDTFDFIPGDLGPITVRLAITTRLALLESYNWAYDVNFTAKFDDEATRKTTLTIPGEDMDCCEGPDCDPCKEGDPNCGSSDDVGSFDPNDIIGPDGAPDERWISSGTIMPFTIRFENDAEKATAPAAVVTVNHTLDSDLDFSTFRLGRFGFGDTIIDDAVGLSSFTHRYDRTSDLGIFIDVSAGIDTETGQATWKLTSIDPDTGQIPFNPFLGFLPPNKIGSEGEGFFNFSVRPKGELPTGTRIDAVAEIIFDQNEAIDTPPIFNTIDADPPSSSVTALPVNSFPGALVTWTGDDDIGSGVEDFDIYVAQDGGPFELWLQQTTATEARFLNAEIGSTYEFYSVAFDRVGNAESAPAAADTSTTIVEPATTTVTDVALSESNGVPTLTITFADDVDVTAAVNDGSIADAFSLLSLQSGQLDLSTWQFGYDSDSNSLELTAPQTIPAGRYELQLDGSQITTADGAVLRGGSSGLTFGVPEFAGLQRLPSSGGDLKVAAWSAPRLVDWNADGRPDLIVSEVTPEREGKLRVYVNTGTATTPVFDSFTYVPTLDGDLSVGVSASGAVVPAFADLSGDGDADMVLGLPNGRLQYWINIGSAANPMFALPSLLKAGPADDKQEISLVNGATVDLADWDNNGTIDVIAGSSDGRVRVYLNSSAQGQPNLASEHIVQNGTGDLVVPTDRSAVSVFDLNGDGRKDLILGNAEGNAVFYPNTGSDNMPRFDGRHLLTGGGSTIDLIGFPRSFPTFGDLNSDGTSDLLLGTNSGFVSLFTGTGSVIPVDVPAVAGGSFRHTFEFSASPQSGDVPSITGPMGTDIANPPLITWSGVADAVGYELWLQNINVPNVLINPKSISGMEFRPTTPLPDGLYRVWAKGELLSGSETDWSSAFSFFIGPEPPGQPVLPDLGTGSLPARPTFSWPAVADADTYEIWFDNLSTGQKEVLRVRDIDGLTFTPSMDLPQGRYEVWLRAANAADNGPWSNGIRILIGAPEPGPVAGLAIDASGNAARPTVSWTAQTDATSYQIWFNNRSTGEQRVIVEDGITDLTFTPAVDLVDSTYAIWVRGINPTGFGAWSEVLSMPVGTGIPARAEISAPTGTTPNPRPMMEWNAVAGAAEYRVWLNDVTRSVSQLILTTTSATSLVPDFDLAEGKYRIWVQTVYGAGRGPWSSARDFRIGEPAPDAPIITTLHGSRLSTQPQLTWQSVTGALSYEVWIDNLTTGAREVVRMAGLSATSFTPNSPLTDDVHRFWVRAANQNGIGEWSEAIDFAAGTAAPLQPVLITTSSTVNERRPVISWNPAAGADSYEIWVQDRTRNVNQLLLDATAATTYQFGTDLADGDYRIWVKALSAHGDSQWSRPLDIAVEVTANTRMRELDELFADPLQPLFCESDPFRKNTGRNTEFTHEIDGAQQDGNAAVRTARDHKRKQALSKSEQQLEESVARASSHDTPGEHGRTVHAEGSCRDEDPVENSIPRK